MSKIIGLGLTFALTAQTAVMAGQGFNDSDQDSFSRTTMQGPTIASGVSFSEADFDVIDASSLKQCSYGVKPLREALNVLVAAKGMTENAVKVGANAKMAYLNFSSLNVFGFVENVKNVYGSAKNILKAGQDLYENRNKTALAAQRVHYYMHEAKDKVVEISSRIAFVAQAGLSKVSNWWYGR